MKTQDDSFSRFEYAGWERVAYRYDEAWSGLTKLFVPAVLDALRLRPGAWVLDVACGPGYVAEEARRRGAMAIGIDFSPAMVEIASRSKAASSSASVKLRKGAIAAS